MKEKYTLGMALGQRSNNLQVMKFLAAICVIICHAFALTGNDEKEWLDLLTCRQMDFGMFAVSVFFLSSGLLIAKSMERTKTFSAYFKTRCVRILPPLVIVVLLSVLAGAFLTELPLGAYMTDSQTYKYLLNGIFILQHSLPGVFCHNVYGSAVNGALWTLPIEFLCYIACFVVYKIHGFEKKNIVVITALYVAGAFVGVRIFTAMNITLLISALQPCWLFLVGMVLYIYRDHVVLDARIFIGALFLMAVCFAFSLTTLALWGCLPYVILYPAFMKKQCPKNIAKMGNYSYTIYLCAFPIQQTVIALAGGSMTPAANLLISGIAAVAAGMILFHWGEKPLTHWLLSTGKSKKGEV